MAVPRRRTDEMDLASLMGPEEGIPAEGGMSALPTGADTDVLSDQDLAGLAGEGTGGLGEGLDPEGIAVDQLEAALNDPATPPEDKQMIQAQLAMAARRKLAGIGQAPGLPTM